MHFDVTRPFDGVGGDERKKRAFLVGDAKGSQKVQFLYKLALYRGMSISIYDLISGESRKISRPNTSTINDIIDSGREIDHPAIPAENAPEWVKHGKREAAKLGLTVSR